MPYQKKTKQGIDNMQPFRHQTLGRLAVGQEDIKLLKEKLLCIKLKTILRSKLRKKLALYGFRHTKAF